MMKPEIKYDLFANDRVATRPWGARMVRENGSGETPWSYHVSREAAEKQLTVEFGSQAVFYSVDEPATTLQPLPLPGTITTDTGIAFDVRALDECSSMEEALVLAQAFRNQWCRDKADYLNKVAIVLRRIKWLEEKDKSHPDDFVRGEIDFLKALVV